jgi:hypothetical protein
MTNKTELSRDDAAAVPLSITVAKACDLSGFGPTLIWGLLKTGRLRAVRIPGVRRTLVDYESLRQLLAPSEPEQQPQRKRGRPRKTPQHEAVA